MSQLKLDFSPRSVMEGKKVDRIPVAVSTDLKHLVEQIAQKQNRSVSEIAHRYLVEGIMRDIGSLYLQEPFLNDSLKEILRKFF